MSVSIVARELDAVGLCTPSKLPMLWLVARAPWERDLTGVRIVAYDGTSRLKEEFVTVFSDPSSTSPGSRNIKTLTLHILGLYILYIF